MDTCSRVVTLPGHPTPGHPLRWHFLQGPLTLPRSGPEKVLGLGYLKCGPGSGSSCPAACLLSRAEPGPQPEIEIPVALHFTAQDALASAIRRHRRHPSALRAKNTPDICEGLRWASPAPYRGVSLQVSQAQGNYWVRPWLPDSRPDRSLQAPFLKAWRWHPESHPPNATQHPMGLCICPLRMGLRLHQSHQQA